MKISTKGRYALQMMLDLASHNKGEYVTINDISERQEISEKYLEQIISILKRAGYVKSIRGSQGGYRLAKDPNEYTIGMILRITEGNFSIVPCLEDEAIQCSKQNECVTLRLWQMIEEALNGVIDKVTLEDLVSWQMEKVGDYII